MKDVAESIDLTSPAFRQREAIPRKYTCEGPDVSPPLQWNGVPPGARSIALICDDPDAPAGTWVHWVFYAIPPSREGLEEGIPKNETLPDGSRQGRNDFKRTGYGGPCPPPGKPHRYFFKLYALDRVIDLPAGATKKDLVQAMEGHVLARGELMATYKR